MNNYRYRLTGEADAPYFGVTRYMKNEIGINGETFPVRASLATIHEIIHAIRGPLPADETKEYEHQIVANLAYAILRASRTFREIKDKIQYPLSSNVKDKLELRKVEKWDPRPITNDRDLVQVLLQYENFLLKIPNPSASEMDQYCNLILKMPLRITDKTEVIVKPNYPYRGKFQNQKVRRP